jgi:hypothetical protein
MLLIDSVSQRGYVTPKVPVREPMSQSIAELHKEAQEVVWSRGLGGGCRS